MNVRLARAIAVALLGRKEQLAVVETTTGGLLQASLVAVPGASGWFVGGAIAYSVPAQEALLGVSPGPDGVVSAESAIALAEAARWRLQVDWSLAETGVAGPQSGRRSTKPAGLTFVAIAGPSGTTVSEVTLPDLGRQRNQQAFARRALELLHELLT